MTLYCKAVTLDPVKLWLCKTVILWHCENIYFVTQQNYNTLTQCSELIQAMLIFILLLVQDGLPNARWCWLDLHQHWLSSPAHKRPAASPAILCLICFCQSCNLSTHLPHPNNGTPHNQLQLDKWRNLLDLESFCGILFDFCNLGNIRTKVIQENMRIFCRIMEQ